MTSETDISLPAPTTSLTRLAISPDGHVLYATDSSNNKLLRFDTKKRLWLSPVSVLTAPIGVAVSPSGNVVVVAGQFGVDVVNTSTRAVRHLAGSGTYEGVVVSPDGRYAYAGSYADVVTKFDLQTGLSSDIDVSGGNSSQPQSVAISPDGSKVYAADTAQNRIEVISTVTETVTAVLLVGVTPDAVTISPDGSHAYVSNFATSTVSVISTAIDSVEATVVAGDHPGGVIVSPDGTQFAVTSSYTQQLLFFSTHTNTQVSAFTISAGSGTSQPTALVFSPNGAQVYVSLPSGVALGIFQLTPHLGSDVPEPLANTGSNPWLPLWLGLAMLSAGAMALLTVRRLTR